MPTTMHPLIASALASHRDSKSDLWRRRFFLFLNLSAPFLIWLTHGTQPWVWLFAFVVHHTLLIALFFPRCNWLGPVLTQLPTEEKIIWLTIDDGPSEDTIELAEMLAKMGVSATFFLQGKKLTQYPEALAALSRHGHTVANHTENHDLAWFWIYPPWRVVREVDDFTNTARRLNLPLIPAFRCPAGLKNPFLPSVLHHRQLTLTGWSIRAYDGIRCNPQKNLQHILPRLKPGAILLVHEGKKNAVGAPASVEFIRQLVLQVQTAGYRFI